MFSFIWPGYTFKIMVFVPFFLGLSWICRAVQSSVQLVIYTWYAYKRKHKMVKWCQFFLYISISRSEFVMVRALWLNQHLLLFPMEMLKVQIPPSPNNQIINKKKKNWICNYKSLIYSKLLIEGDELMKMGKIKF